MSLYIFPYLFILYLDLFHNDRNDKRNFSVNKLAITKLIFF